MFISGLVFAQEEKSTNTSKKVVSKESKPEEMNTVSLGSPMTTETSSFNKQPVIEEIKAQLATMASKPLQELLEFCRKKEIKGEFVVDLTVEGKGQIVTVFMVSGGESDITKKNLLKNKLTELHFENVKIPKKERVKLRYTLNF